MLGWLWPRCCASCGEASLGAFCDECAPGTVLRPKPSSLGISEVFSLERYERPAGQALRKAKVGGDRTRLCGLAQTWARTLGPVLRGSEDATIVPAPSRSATRFKRGFAAASVFARALGQQLNLPVVHALRTRARTRLARLDARQRRLALDGRIRALRDVPGHVFLVDDVLTTGATAEACALELIGGSTSRVTLVTFCVVSTPRALV